MFKIFEKQQWRRDTVTEARGSSHGLSITLRNMPSIYDRESGERRFLEVDFGVSILDEILEAHLRPFEGIRDRIRSDGKVTYVMAGRFSGIEFSVSGKSIAKQQDRFESAVADALIACFRAMGIKSA